MTIEDKHKDKIYYMKLTKARESIQETADKLHGGRFYFDGGETCHFIVYDYVSSKFRIQPMHTLGMDTIVFKDQFIAYKCYELCENEFNFLFRVRG